jgi:hypothetical protein
MLMRSSCQCVGGVAAEQVRAQRQAQTAMRSEETDSGQTEVPRSSMIRSCTNQSVVQ